ncbi:hypothetical protein [Halonotius pteroides]|uniref:Uncharacterized protein n=1 Tax=Halonotius pteroides TaxID=268735 RepID=A0A3A6QNR4_9EURY|nr:hypothetical protein [Halonotius pteroides]RJX50054.1 hypothetical protein DP106_06130 [Halonotius pteroides]
MPSHADTVDSDATTDDRTAVPSVVRTAARRYWRRTLALRALTCLGYFVISIAVLFTLPYIPALAGIVVLLGTLAAPVFKTGGTIELTTDRSPAAVRDDFTDATPPVVGFQAALADEIRSTATGAEYDLSTALGLRSATMTIETERLAGDSDTADGDAADSNADLELVVTVGDKPWGRYTVTTDERDGKTAVRITMIPARRFGVRRLPDFVFGRRYRRQLFDGQGYTLVADDTSLSVRS